MRADRPAFVEGFEGGRIDIGEVSAVRQMLGHADLAEYVGDFPPEAEYRPER